MRLSFFVFFWTVRGILLTNYPISQLREIILVKRR